MSRYLNISSTCILASGLMLAMFVPLQSAEASAFKVLYTFQGAPDASDPQGVIADKAGNLYGAALRGGTGRNGEGAIFKLAPDGTETLLYSWKGGVRSGFFPDSGLIEDKKGNFYGTTLDGGGGIGPCGCGAVYEISPSGTETVAYGFKGGSDGALPQGGLIMDKAGNIYGTTSQGGGTGCAGGVGCGTVFKVTKTGSETVLYSFCTQANCTDGSQPYAGLIADSAGNLFGTTIVGGADGYGTVFEIAANGTENVLYSFKGGSDGAEPLTGLIADGSGNFYGTTVHGGTSSQCQGCRTVFKLAGDGTETVLYTFTGGSDGGGPIATLVADRQGNLYGMNNYGGGGGCNGGGCGTIFKLAPNGTETTLHAFSGGSDGALPQGGLILTNGYLFGTATEGGGGSCLNGAGCGTVFSVKR